jgi:hypothetical protein
MSIGKEVIIIRSRIAAIKQEEGACDLRADSYIRMIREEIDPLLAIKDFLNLDLDRAQLIMHDLLAVRDKKKSLAAERLRLEKELNG